MTNYELKRNLRNFGLIGVHNPIKNIRLADSFELPDLDGVIHFGSNLLMRAVMQMGRDYRANLIIMKNNGEFHLLTNDYQGINVMVAEKNFLKGFVQKFHDEDFIIVYEKTANHYALVSQAMMA